MCISQVKQPMDCILIALLSPEQVSEDCKISTKAIEQNLTVRRLPIQLSTAFNEMLALHVLVIGANAEGTDGNLRTRTGSQNSFGFVLDTLLAFDEAMLGDVWGCIRCFASEFASALCHQMSSEYFVHASIFCGNRVRHSASVNDKLPYFE